MKHKRLIIFAVVLALLAGCVGAYAADYYRADSNALAAMSHTVGYTVTEDNGLTVFAPDSPVAGLIFYPGGKVEHTAYAPLMGQLAGSGVLCVITEMPLHLAVLDMDAAAGVPPLFPHVDTWYIGGHSLGGAMAASYVAETEGFAGLVLLGAYSTADLSDTGLRVLSIYGEQDGVLNREKYAACWGNLPGDTTELVIGGGNHAMFGDYGRQDGDGEGWISPLEQQTETAQAVLEWMGLAEASTDTVYRAWVQTEGGMLRSVLTLMPSTGEFVLSRRLIDPPVDGRYRTQGDVLVCEGDNGVYRFRLTDGAAVYLAAESDAVFAHGSSLGDNPNATALVPDGTVYEMQ